LRGKIKLYIFISSDSIYDVCDPKQREEPKILEDYDKRPDGSLKKKLIKKDSYGHVK